MCSCKIHLEYNLKTIELLTLLTMITKKILLCVIGLLFLSLNSYCQTILANDPLIEFNGRVDFTNALQPKFSYSGSSVRAMFKGTTLKATLSDTGGSNYYNVIVDGVVSKRINIVSASTVYDLASGLPDGVHEIELFKLTESSFGITTFMNFILDVGKTLVPITTTRTRHIEFIGDSITCGSGNEAASTNVPQLNTNQNHYLSYAAMTARNFNAKHVSVSKSGVGLLISYTTSAYPDKTLESINSMNNYYDRMHWGTATTPSYDFAKKPDLICVNLGTNDFSMGVNNTSFELAYLNFIDKLQLKSPVVDIIVLLGPMLAVGGYNYRTFKPILQRVATTANAKNKGNVYFFEMSAIATGEITGSAGHPSLLRHAANAQELTDFIKTIKPTWTLSLKDFEKNNSINFYPNPTKDFLNTAVIAETGDKFFINIIDFQGRIIINKNYTAELSGVNNFSIPVFNLQAGIFVVEVSDVNRKSIFSNKFIKN